MFSRHSEFNSAKKIFLLLFASCSIFSAHAQSCVSVRQISTNYATKQITFDLTWSTCNNTNHLYRVWVFADYQPVTDLTKGAWSRATIASSSAGKLHNNSGVWVTGSQNATQRVTLTLNVLPAQFNWCVVATDYPPNATLSNGIYTLRGTPPFIINGSSTWSAKTYMGDITTITDATNNPEGFINIPTCSTSNVNFGTVGFVSAQTWVVGSQTWSAPVTATYCNKATLLSGTNPYVTDCRNNSQGSYGHLFNWCMVKRYATILCPTPWRVPTSSDFCYLDKTLNSRTVCDERNDASSLSRYFSIWGAEYSGMDHGDGVLTYQGSQFYYWSNEECGSDRAYRFYSHSPTNLIGINQCNQPTKQHMHTLRCVQ